MRFPEKAARRSAESRGQGSLVPAPADHIAFWRNRRRRLPLLGFQPAAPRNGEVDPRRLRGSESLRARGATGELRGAHYGPAGSGHTDPPAFVAAASSCPTGRPPALTAGQQLVVAGGQRAGGYARGAPLRQEAPAPVAESTAISPPVPAAGGGGCQGGETERAWDGAQTLSTKGVRSLSEAASRGLKGGRGWGLQVLRDF